MATQADVDELLSKMRAERATLIAALDDIDEEQAAVRPPEGEGEAGWSVKEQLAHLAEMEVSYREWVRRAIAEDQPDVTTGNHPDPVAHPHARAHEATVPQHLAELASQRERTLEVIESIPLEGYERTASNQLFGELTVMQWLRSYYRHDRMHAAQIQGRESDYTPRWAPGQGEPQRATRIEEERTMLKTTADTFPDREITETLGLVVANAVRARHVGQDILAGLKNLVGGEIGAYQHLLMESRDEAIGRLEREAEAMGADGIVALRMATSSIAQGASEVLVYGTAVKLRAS